MRKKLTLVAGVIMAGVLLLANNAFSKECFYFNEFEGAIGLEWSDTIQSTTPSGRKFLGQFANDSVTLTLTGLPAHLSVSVSFDLYLIESTGENGEHFFELSIDDGPVLMTTSFSHNPDSTQSYPDNYPGGDYPGQTGAAEVDKLGYIPNGDMVYSFPDPNRSFTFTHTNSTLVVRFSGSGSAGQWGLDNVCITLGLPTVLNVIDIDPNTLNLNSEGKWITSYLWLPEGYNVADVEPNTVMLGYSIPADWIWFDEETQLLMAKFSRSAVENWLIEQELSGEVELSMTGAFIDETTFGGTDTIRIIGEDKNKNNSNEGEGIRLTRITPSTLNIKGNSEWVTCHLRLPEGSNATDIKLETVMLEIMLENVIAADWLVFNENNQIAMIKFSGSVIRDYLIEHELLGDVELTVTGELIDGTTFAVSDTIKVINKGGKKK
ncbi:MAG: hypothetical protein IIB56_04605 [Planctomycetes bacterium]|nr:hypothetical protein [Planctomycetota bacterium]